MAFFRFVGAVNAIAVYRAGLKPRDIAMPYFVGEFRQVDTLGLFLAFLVEETKLDPGRVCGEQSKVNALSVPHRTARERLSFANLDFSPVRDRFQLRGSHRTHFSSFGSVKICSISDANVQIGDTGFGNGCMKSRRQIHEILYRTVPRDARDEKLFAEPCGPLLLNRF